MCELEERGRDREREREGERHTKAGVLRRRPLMMRGVNRGDNCKESTHDWMPINTQALYTHAHAHTCFLL